MKDYAFLILLSVGAALIAFRPGVAIAQTELRRDTSIERALAGGQTHSYRVPLQDGQFMLAVVDQRGIDVVVQVFDPEGTLIDEIDSPNGTHGPEPISLFTQTTGDYRIEVRPLEEQPEAPGRYAMNIERLEAIAATPTGKIDQLLALWNKPDSPGAALAVIQDGEIIHQRGYGSANLEYGIPITPATVFHVASVSKQFTAFAIAMLAAQGKLSLDDEVRTYLPEMPDFGETITLRHLVHHTSGLRDQWNLLALAGWRLDDVITRDHILKTVEHQKDLNFAPGDEIVYCNTGYTLLAEIVERVTGQTFRAWTTEHLFEPLGMTNTHFHDDHEMVVPNRAYSYARGPEGQFKKAVLSYANAGATSLFTTVEDLAAWVHNLDTGTVGGTDVIDWMHNDRVVLNSGDTLGYAFGLSIGEYKGLRTVGHSGGDAGFRSYLVRFPDQGFAVAVLGNLASFNPRGSAMEIAELYLSDQMAADEPETGTPSSPEVQDSPFTLSTDQLSEFTGAYYSDELGTTYTIVVENDRLVARHRRHEDIALTPKAVDAFTGDAWFFSRVSYTRNERDEITGLRVSSGRVRDLRFEKQMR